MKAAARKKEVFEEGPAADLAAVVDLTMKDAEEQGFLDANDSRVTARLSAKMVAAAKARTGIKSDSDLVKFAIAQLAVEDPFKKAFRELRGSVDPDLDLEF
jgi:hypothetical protein